MKSTIFALLLFCLVGCTSSPRTGYLSNDHREIFRTTDSVCLLVSKYCPQTYRKTPDIKHDASVILKATGLNVSSVKSDNCILIEIVAQWHHLHASYRTKSRPFANDYIAGSDLDGWITITLPKSVSYRRTFSGHAPPPFTLPSLAELSPQYDKAYQNSNFVSVMSDLLSEVYGKQVSSAIQKAIKVDQDIRLASVAAGAAEVLSELARNNKEHIAKLKAYEPSVLTEVQFFQDGWDVMKPTRGRVGILSFKKRNGTNTYILGYYATSSDSLDSEVNRDLVEGSKMIMKQPNGEFNIQMSDAPRIVICDLVFVDGILHNQNWR